MSFEVSGIPPSGHKGASEEEGDTSYVDMAEGKFDQPQAASSDLHQVRVAAEFADEQQAQEILAKIHGTSERKLNSREEIKKGVQDAQNFDELLATLDAIESGFVPSTANPLKGYSVQKVKEFIESYRCGDIPIYVKDMLASMQSGTSGGDALGAMPRAFGLREKVLDLIRKEKSGRFIKQDGTEAPRNVVKTQTEQIAEPVAESLEESAVQSEQITAPASEETTGQDEKLPVSGSEEISAEQSQNNDQVSQADWKQSEDYRQFQQGHRELFHEMVGGDMEKIKRAAIVEKYLREEVKQRGIVVGEEMLNRLMGIIEKTDNEGRSLYGMISTGQVEMPDLLTGNIIVQDRMPGGGYKEAFVSNRSQQEVEQEEELFHALGEALKLAITKADAEIAAGEFSLEETVVDNAFSVNDRSNQNEVYKEVSMGSIKGSPLKVPSGEHWIVDSVQGSPIRVLTGAKITIRGNVLGSPLNIESGAQVIIQGNVERSPIRKAKDSKLTILGRSTGVVVKTE